MVQTDIIDWLYSQLRSQQGLLVDFSAFPAMLVQLLEKCLAEGQTSQPRFVLVLNLARPQPCLEFTELNLFKHLVHLALVVLKPTDGQLQEFLVARYGRVALSCNAKY